MALPELYMASLETVYYIWSFLSFINSVENNIILLSFLIFCLFIFAVYLTIPPPPLFDVEVLLGKLRNSNKDEEAIRELFYKYEKPSNRTFCIARRGGLLDAPENSLSAIRMAKSNGCTAAELDVNFTLDGIPIVFHDDSLERVTNNTGYIQEKNWSEINELDISVNHPLSDRFTGEKIPTLADALAECLMLNMKVVLNIRSNNLKKVALIADLFKDTTDLHLKVLVTSFNPLAIYAIRRRNPNVVCGISYRPGYFTTSYNGLKGAEDERTKNFVLSWLFRMLEIFYWWLFKKMGYLIIGISAVLLHKDMVKPEDVKAWNENCVHVIPWTVNMPIEKQYYSRVLKLKYITETMVGESVVPKENDEAPADA